jgi:phenylacetate-CoA ligase
LKERTLHTLPDAKRLLTQLPSEPEKHWLERGEAMALKLFHDMSQRVPAYRSFLKEEKVDSGKIKTIQDFKHVPPIDKDNYLRRYSRSDLCWDGELTKQHWVFSTTSGSTGQPYYFPRQSLQDQQYALTAELYLRTNFEIHKKSTLYIVAFPMGAWIGGLFTYEALKIIAERGNYRLSIITPGINKAEVIKAVQNLGQDFDQIIIGSYAPFLKDIIDDGIRVGLNWADYKLGFIFSAEGFSEVFRDYVIRKTGLQNVYKDTLNHYGTVDLGTMSHETPLAVLLRRLALEQPAVYQNLFTEAAKLPTLTQYLPELFYFEDEGGNLLCSANSGLPLVRYDLKDKGGVVYLDELKQKLSLHGINLDDECHRAGITDTLWNLPLVYVYERSDFSVSFYAFQVYPETIRKALLASSVEHQVTGKFTMLVDFDTSGRQFLEINVELSAGTLETEQLNQHLTELVVGMLLQENSEYRATHELYGAEVYPRIVFWPYEDANYFRPGTKQKWVKK